MFNASVRSATLLALLAACTNPVTPDKGADLNDGDVNVTVDNGETATSALFTFSPADGLDFGEVEVGTTASLPITVTYHGADPVDLVVGELDDSVWSVTSLAEITMVSEGSVVVTVQFAPTEEGSYAGGITLSGSDVATAFACKGEGIITDSDPLPGATDDDGDGLTEDDGDCDDGNAAIHPGATDLCDGVDNNCDGADQGCDSPDPAADSDGDGYTPDAGDCDDASSAINPGASEICDNIIDDNCNGQADEADAACIVDPGGDTGVIDDTGTPPDVDVDGDGHDSDDSGGDDCDDTDPAVNPDAVEACDNGLDDDCDGDTDEDCETDDDGDGFNTDTDCDDTDPAVNPGATEACNGIDDNCDNAVDEGGVCIPTPDDSDGDGFPDTDDCDDANPAVNPGASEVCDDGIDNDCDGQADSADATDCPTDDDGDGYTPDDGDCDDADPDIHPDGTEVCNGLDDNCDTQIDEGGVCIITPADVDGDGYDSVADGGLDCDDQDAAINPLATEVCDGRDNDCDGEADNTPDLSFSFSSPSDGPQPFSDATVYGWYDTGTWSCSGSSGPINLSICTDDESVLAFDSVSAEEYKADLMSAVDSWVGSSPLIDSDGVSYSVVSWVDATVEDRLPVCVFVGVEIAP